MKKILVLFMLLTALFLAHALCEEAQDSQERLITSPYSETGETLGLIISSMDGDDSVQVYGVESDPAPCTYQGFSETFIRFMEKNFEYPVKLTGPYFSDGYWAYMMMDGQNRIVVKTNGDTPEALIAEILVLSDPEYSDAAAILGAACMHSAAKCGQYGQYAMDLLFYGQGVEDYMQYGCDYWRENGFLLSFDTNEYGFPRAKIIYQENVQTPPPADFQTDYIVPLENGPTLTAFSAYLNQYASWLMLEAPVPPDAWGMQEGYQMYGFYWEDCAVILLADPESDQLAHLTIASLSGDTTSLWGRTCLLYAAAVQAPEEDFYPPMMLTGGSGGWDLLSSMQPYVYWQGAVLQCMEDDALDGAPYAIICGADALP